MAIKIAESALKRRVCRVGGNTGILFLGLIITEPDCMKEKQKIATLFSHII